MLQVWAPNANKVELEIQKTRLAMTKDAKNWWVIKTPLAVHGADYAFILDGGKPIPDPRSPWQPFGVFGPSRILAHENFVWQDQSWQAPPLTAAIIYELHVGTFSQEGTFDGVINHLEFLKNLGVTHVEVMPINGFVGSRGWGYDGVNIFAPYEIYGGPEGFKRLVNACHNKGLAIILDVVYNHFGPEGNFLEPFGPYFTDRYSSPWGKAINFDGRDSDEVRRFFCDNAIMWFKDYHVDALRIDAVHAIFDNSAIHILEQLSREVKELQGSQNKHYYLITESDLNDSRHLRCRNGGGYGIDAQWNDDFHHALYSILTGEHVNYYQDFGCLKDLAKAYTKVFVYDGRYSSFRRSNHGRPVEGLEGYNFLAYLQNHDQIGNRPHGDRISKLTNINKLKIGAALTILSPFIPMIFQGEEWGTETPFLYFADHQDLGLRNAIFEGRVRELSVFGVNASEIPDPQAAETFNKSKINWSEVSEEPHKSLFSWYQSLIALRKKFSDLSDGRLARVKVVFDEEEKWFMFKRGKIIIIVNFSSRMQIITRKKLNLGDEQLNILMSSDLKNLWEGKDVLLQAESILVLAAI